MRKPSLTADRTVVTAVLLATGWLLVIILLDIVLPISFVPDPLFAIAPLIACSVLSPRVTAAFGGAAVLLLAWSGWWNQTWDTPQQWIRLLDVLLVSVAAVLIATLRVRREQRLRRLAAIAETAQRVILPIVPAAAGGVHTASRYLSAAQDAVVGGDLYDCSVTQGYTRFIVGDVRGKGLEAVEHAARVIRAFRQAAATKSTLLEAARDMDDYLTPFLGSEDFVTALLVDVTREDEIILTSCGHPPAILVRPDGSTTFLDSPAGVPLGLGHATEDRRFAWTLGDRILLYTDGLSEARNEHGDFLPLLDVAPMLAMGGLDEALDALLDLARAHVPHQALADDLAVLLLENTAGPATGAEVSSYDRALVTGSPMPRGRPSPSDIEEKRIDEGGGRRPQSWRSTSNSQADRSCVVGSRPRSSSRQRVRQGRRPRDVPSQWDKKLVHLRKASSDGRASGAGKAEANTAVSCAPHLDVSKGAEDES